VCDGLARSVELQKRFGNPRRKRRSFQHNASLQIRLHPSRPLPGCSQTPVPSPHPACSCSFPSLIIRQSLLQVRCVASTHSGGLVSSSRDCSARLWSSSSDKLTEIGNLQLIGHQNFCNACCAIPPCAKYPAGAVATASLDTSIIIWDNCEPTNTLLGHTAQVLWLFLPIDFKFTNLIPAIQVNSVSAAVLDGNLVLISCGNDLSIKVLYCFLTLFSSPQSPCRYGMSQLEPC
jgi:WD40 repeat protein